MLKWLEAVETTVQPWLPQVKILETAYQLYLQAPNDEYPIINLNDLAQRTGHSMWECRNVIVQANKVGQFPNCALYSE